VPSVFHNSRPSCALKAERVTQKAISKFLMEEERFCMCVNLFYVKCKGIFSGFANLQVKTTSGVCDHRLGALSTMGVDGAEGAYDILKERFAAQGGKPADPNTP
jgi:hypothetical protein